MSAEVSPALRALLDLMTDSGLWLGRRIEAAKAIIEHEAPPEVFDLTYQFLLGIAEGDVDVEWKLKALALLRKVEAKRVVPGTTTRADSYADQALARRIATARERLKLMEAGNWPPGPGWADGLSPERLAPVELENMAERLKRARTV